MKLIRSFTSVELTLTAENLSSNKLPSFSLLWIYSKSVFKVLGIIPILFEE